MLAGLNPILILITLVLAGGTIGVTAILSPGNRPLFAYASLVMMVGIYVGFAIIAFDAAEFVTRPVITVLMIEILTALVLMFVGLGFAASDRPWLLGVLILIHGGIDLVHLLTGTPHSPAWYEFLCIIYDAIVGVAFVWLLSKAPEAVTDTVTEAVVEDEEINSVYSNLQKGRQTGK